MIGLLRATERPAAPTTVVVTTSFVPRRSDRAVFALSLTRSTRVPVPEAFPRIVANTFDPRRTRIVMALPGRAPLTRALTPRMSCLSVTRAGSRTSGETTDDDVGGVNGGATAGASRLLEVLGAGAAGPAAIGDVGAGPAAIGDVVAAASTV